jgi:protein transport protein SEC23
VIDIFACSLDQNGLLEMQDLVKRTGGYIVLADAFEGPMFKQVCEISKKRNLISK